MLNLLIVWLLTGIWHGARFAFISWGLGYFILLVIEKYFVKPEKRTSRLIRILWQVFTLFCVNFGWVVFNSNGLRAGVRYCIAMLGHYGTPFQVDAMVLYYLREYGFFITAGIICATPLFKYLGAFADRKKATALIHTIAAPICYGLCFLWAVSYLVLGAHNPFIYFNF